MNPDKKTDYKTLQIYAWYACALSVMFVVSLMFIAFLYEFFETEKSLLLGIANLAVFIAYTVLMVLHFKRKINEIKSS